MFTSISQLSFMLMVGCSSINLSTGRSMIINLEDPNSVLSAPDMPDNMKTFLLNMMMDKQQDTPASTTLPADKHPAASLPLFPSPPASSSAGQRKTTPVRRSVKDEERRNLKEVATKVRRFARSEAARQQLFNRFTQMVNREVPIKPVVRRRVVLPASIVLAGAAEARRRSQEQQLAAAVSGQSQFLSSLIAQSGGPAVPANQDSSADDRLASAVRQAASTNQLLAHHQFSSKLAPLTANQRTLDRSLDGQLASDWFTVPQLPVQSSTNFEVPESLI